MRRLGLIGIVLAAVWLAFSPAPMAAQSDEALPPPHLGYGIHIGPHLEAPPAMIGELGMDWVKVYDVGQADDYAAFRVLYRMDLSWPDDWNAFRQNIIRLTRDLLAAGVDAIEVHNEPNLSLEWPRGPNAWEYVQVLRVAYQTIKSVAPRMIVVSGGLAPTLTTADRGAINDLDFAREMLENGAAQYFDAFGYHPYGFNQPPEADPGQYELTFRRVERVRALLVRYGVDQPIWLTEFGWLRDPAERSVNCTAAPAFDGFAWMTVPLATQADYTVRAFAYADRHWPWAGPTFLWNLNWQLYDEGYEDPCSHLRWYGLLEPDGTPTATYRAVAAMPHRYPSYRPRLEVRPIPRADVQAPVDGAAPASANEWGFAIAAYCPQVVSVGEFEVVNTGWFADLILSVEPLNVPGAGVPLPVVYASAARVRFGERVAVHVDVSQTPPGEYLAVVNLRGLYEGRPVSGHARVRLQVENSPVNCQ